MKKTSIFITLLLLTAITSCKKANSADTVTSSPVYQSTTVEDDIIRNKITISASIRESEVEGDVICIYPKKED